MHSYYMEWKFKHPYPEDFKASIEKSTGRNLDTIFNLLNTTGSIATAKKKTLNLPFFSIYGIPKSIII
jgi:hypothetical protein